MIEPQNQRISCFDNSKSNETPYTKNNCEKNCIGLVLSIIYATLTFTIGLILGIIFSESLLVAFPALIVFLFVLILLAVLVTVYINCMKRRKCKF